MRSLIGFRLVLVCVLSLSSHLLATPDRAVAQERKGTIIGHVTDSSGGYDWQFIPEEGKSSWHLQLPPAVII
jgi:hypothetical protein